MVIDCKGVPLKSKQKEKFCLRFGDEKLLLRNEISRVYPVINNKRVLLL